MKTNIKFFVAMLGVGMVVVWLTGCHHFGGGCCAAPPSAPVGTATVNSSPSSAPAQPNAPSGHQH